MSDTPGLSVPLQIPLSKFEKQLAKAEAAAVKRAQSIERKFNEANGRSSQALTKSAAASAQVFERAIQKETSAFEKLRGSLDPAIAAQQRYRAVLDQVQSAVLRGITTKEEANRVIAQARDLILGEAAAKKSAEESARAMEAALQKEAASYDDLQASLDPAYAAQRRFKEITEQTERAVRSGITTQERANDMLARARQQVLGEQGAKSARDSAAIFEKEIHKEAQAFQQLKASVDPAYAAQRRYEAAVRRVEAAVRMGAVSQSDANAVLAQAKAAHLGAASAATAAAAQATGFFKVSGAGRFVIQNTSNQIGDMAVQLQLGTDPMRVMAQQLPQVFGGFGALGGVLGTVAPLLGTVAAIGFPVAAVLLAQGKNAEDSAEKIKDFADAWDKAEAAINRANSAVSRAAAGDLDALRDAYGEVNAEIQNLIETLARLELEKALVATNAAVDQFFTENTQVEQLFQALEDRQKSMVELSREIAAMEDQQALATYVPPENARILAEMRADLEAMERLEGISEDFGVDPSALDSIREARDALQQASESGNMEAMVDAIANMRAVLATIPEGPLADMGDELALAEDLLRRALAQSERLETSASGISFDGAAASASRMADEINRAVDAMYDLRDRGLASLETARIRYEYRDDPVGRAGALAGAEFDRETAALRDAGFDHAGEEAYYNQQRQARIDEAREIARLNEASRPARSGGGARSREETDLFANSEREITALERQIEMVGKSRQEIAALTAKYELLDEARARGIDLNQRSTETGKTLREEIDAQAETIANLTLEAEQYAAQADFMADLNQDMRDGLIDVIVEGENFGGVLEDIAKQLAKAALQAALFGDGPLAGLFGGSGIVSGALGAIGIPGFARGTDYAPGGLAQVGEEGPELVHLPRGSKVIPNHKLGQGNGQSRLDLFVHPSGEFDTRVQQVSGSVAVNVSSQMISENNRQVSQMQRR
jgi:hypothetical protein